jgi:hypothetical protein
MDTGFMVNYSCFIGQKVKVWSSNSGQDIWHTTTTAPIQMVTNRYFAVGYRLQRSTSLRRLRTSPELIPILPDDQLQRHQFGDQEAEGTQTLQNLRPVDVEYPAPVGREVVLLAP